MLLVSLAYLFLFATWTVRIAASAIPVVFANDTLEGNSSAIQKREFFYRRNKIVWDLGVSPAWGVVLKTFTITDMYIPPGQDPKGYNQIGGVRTFGDNQFVFIVGRHGTHEAARWWHSKFSPHETSFDHRAIKLNFAFVGDLEGVMYDGREGLPFIVRNFGLAQGHDCHSNNWWIAAPGSHNIGYNRLTVRPEGANATFVMLRGRWARNASLQVENAHYIWLDVRFP